MKRNDLVFTPAGWALVDGPVHTEDPEGEWVELWVVTPLDDGDNPAPRVFRREELEPEVTVDA